MSAAIFGLIGVVVGALVTGGVDYVMQRRREKAELRQARRVVAGELSDLWYQLETITAGDRWPGEVPEEWFASRMWEAHRPVLASQLSDEDWNELARIYSIATKFRAMFGAGEALRPPAWLVNTARRLRARTAGRAALPRRSAPGEA